VWGRARATFGIKALQQKPSKNHRPPTQGGPLLDARIHYPVHKHPAATQTPHTRHQHPTPPPDTPTPGTNPGNRADKQRTRTGLAGQRPHRQRQQPPRQPAGAASLQDETDPTPAQRAWGRACSLRTQQRADPPHPRTRASPHRRTPRRGARQGTACDVSTHEHRPAPHPGTAAAWPPTARTTARTGGRSSLERR